MKTFDINKQNKRNPFSVPEGYFEQLTERVMANIPETPKEEAGERSGKVVVMPSRRPNRWIGWSVAAAACIAVAILFTSIPQSTAIDTKNTAKVSQQDQVDEQYEQDVIEYAMIDNSDIYSYLSGGM